MKGVLIRVRNPCPAGQAARSKMSKRFLLMEARKADVDEWLNCCIYGLLFFAELGEKHRLHRYGD